MKKRIIIDVREPFEYESGHVKDARNIPLASIGDSSYLKSLPLDSKIILYCRSGNRSALALQILAGNGFVNLVNGINQAMVEKIIEGKTD